MPQGKKKADQKTNTCLMFDKSQKVFGQMMYELMGQMLIFSESCHYIKNKTAAFLFFKGTTWYWLNMAVVE